MLGMLPWQGISMPLGEDAKGIIFNHCHPKETEAITVVPIAHETEMLRRLPSCAKRSLQRWHKQLTPRRTQNAVQPLTLSLRLYCSSSFASNQTYLK
jgi:hypothetical protein